MNYSVIEKIAALYNVALSNIFEHIYTLSADTIEGYLPLFLTLYFIVMGYKAMVGELSKGKKNYFRVFILLPFLITFTFNYATYLKFIVTPILILKDYLVNGISSIASDSNSETTFQMLDVIYFNIFSYVKEELMGNLLTNTFDFFLGAVVLIIYGLLYAWNGFFMLKSLVATSFFLMIGPIPLILFAFDSTQSITFSWLKSVGTYFLFAPISAFFMIFIYWISTGVNADVETNFEFLFLLIVSGWILLQFVKDIPEYANAITGAMSGGGDATGGVKQALRFGSMTGRSATSILSKVKGG